MEAPKFHWQSYKGVVDWIDFYYKDLNGKKRFMDIVCKQELVKYLKNMNSAKQFHEGLLKEKINKLEKRKEKLDIKEETDLASLKVMLEDSKKAKHERFLVIKVKVDSVYCEPIDPFGWKLYSDKRLGTLIVQIILLACVAFGSLKSATKSFSLSKLVVFVLLFRRSIKDFSERFRYIQLDGGCGYFLIVQCISLVLTYILVLASL